MYQDDHKSDEEFPRVNQEEILSTLLSSTPFYGRNTQKMLSSNVEWMEVDNVYQPINNIWEVFILRTTI